MNRWKRTMTPVLGGAGLILLAAVPVRSAEPAPSAPPPAEAECRLVLPPGDLVRVEWDAPTRILVTIRASMPAGPVPTGCARSATAAPDPAGTVVTIIAEAGTLKGIEPAPGGTVVSFLPRPSAGAGGYRIGMDDELTVSVTSHNITRDVVVDRNGSVTFDYVGAVPVAGQSPAEAALMLQNLLDKDFLVNPEVSVSVKQYASQYVFVTGEVRKPGKVSLRGSTTLKDVLAEAGGFEREASDEVVVTRQHGGDAPEVFRFARSKVEGDVANMPLQPHDEVHVPERRDFFIQGEVQLPNKYAYSPGVTLMQSISIANGLKEWANRRQVRILRTSEGRADKLVFDLRDIERQKAPDPVLEPGDIVIVPRRLM